MVTHGLVCRKSGVDGVVLVVVVGVVVVLVEVVVVGDRVL